MRSWRIWRSTWPDQLLEGEAHEGQNLKIKKTKNLKASLFYLKLVTFSSSSKLEYL